MAIYNAAGTLQRADDFSANYGTGTLEVRAGATVLAAYQIAGMTTANSGNDATATLDPVAPVNNSATGLADGVFVLDGTKQIELVIGSEVTISDLNYIADVESSVTGLVINFAA